MTKKVCQKHQKQLTHICLAQQCKQGIFLCSTCKDQNLHKHSKIDIQEISQIKSKLKEAWEPKQSTIDPYFKKITVFYDNLRKDINKLIDQDKKSVEVFLTKLKYHHLPFEANSHAYLEFLSQEYDQVDKGSILKLINQAQNGEYNKDLSKQKQISDFLDLELKKINDKVLTLKYVLLSKKFESQLLMPNLSEQSKVACTDEFIKIYSLFNSRKMLIRSAKLIYRGSENDFQPKSFYNQCIGNLNCLAIAKTKNNKLVGGFTPLPLVHHDEEAIGDKDYFEADNSKKSFIFSITNLRSYSIKDSSKAVLYRKDNLGPSFGKDLDFGNVLTSNLGNSYESAEGVKIDSLQAKVYLLETDKAEYREMEIWQLSF